MVDPEYLVGLFHGISQSINGWLKGNPICIAHGSKIYPVPGKHLILGEEGSKHVETHPVANITLIRIPLFWCKTKGTVLIGFRSFQTVCSKLIGFWSLVSILCPSVWIISDRPAAVSRPFSHAETMEVSMRIVPLWVNTPRSARSTQNETLSVINFNSTSGDFQGQLLPVSRHTGHSSLKQQRCAHLDTSGGRCEEFHGVFYFWCKVSIHSSINKSM